MLYKVELMLPAIAHNMVNTLSLRPCKIGTKMQRGY